jgi:hypothetical protein
MGENKDQATGWRERRVEDASGARAWNSKVPGGAGRIRTKSKGRQSKRGERARGRGAKEARSRGRGTARDCYGLHRSESLKACLPAIPSSQFLSFFLLVHPVLHCSSSSSSISLSRHPHPRDDAHRTLRRTCSPIHYPSVVVPGWPRAVRACGGGRGGRQPGGRQEWQRVS